MSVLGDRFRNGFQPRPPTTPDLDGGRFLADLYKKDSIQANFLQRIINAVNRLARNAGVGATGEIAPPPPIAAVNVKVSGELAHVTLTHNAPVRRGIQYFLEVDTSPSFPQPIVKHLGSSRSPEPFALPTFDDNGAKHSYYMRAYAQYPGSKPSGTTAFGGSTVPSAITMGGQTRLSLLPSTGSGTGSPKGQQGGQGLGKYPESSKPNPFSAGVVVKQTSPLIAPAPPAVPPTFDQVKLPVGPMQVSQDNLPDGPTFKRILNVNADNTFHVSSSFNNNGNVPASALNNGFLTLKLGSTGGSSVVMQWGGSQAGLMDGSFINMGIGSFSPPPAPTLSQIAGGTNSAVTWFARIALVRDNMIMAVGPEASFAVSANHLLSVASPSSVAGMDGWIPLISGSTNTEFVPTDRKNGIGLNFIAFGTNYTEPTGGFSFTGQGVNDWAVPLSSGSATSVTPTNCLLAASTTYFFYPSYDLVNQMLSFPAATGFTPGLATAKNTFLAIAQCGDQRIALSTGAVSFTTPAANGSSSTTGGGGGGGGRALQ